MLHIFLHLFNVLASFLEGMFDARKHLRGGVINHGSSALFRCIAWLAAVGFVYIVDDISTYQVSAYFLMFAFEYWIIFDPTYNHFAHQPWWSTGDNSGMDGILPDHDNRFKRLAMKCSLLCMSIVAYICL